MVWAVLESIVEGLLYPVEEHFNEAFVLNLLVAHSLGEAKTHLVKTLDVSLVSTEDGSEQGNIHEVVTIPGKRTKERPYLHKI